MPGARPTEFIENDNEPSRAAGNISQALFTGLVSATTGVPREEDRELVFAVAVPSCITEKERLVGENVSCLLCANEVNDAVTKRATIGSKRTTQRIE